MLNQKAWKLKHQLITESITKSGDFDLEEIDRKVFEILKINSYELPEENQPSNAVVDTVQKIIKPAN